MQQYTLSRYPIKGEVFSDEWRSWVGYRLFMAYPLGDYPTVRDLGNDEAVLSWGFGGLYMTGFARAQALWQDILDNYVTRYKAQ